MDTRPRAELYRWLQEKASPVAPVYLGALRIVMDESFPGRVHFVGTSEMRCFYVIPETITVSQRPHVRPVERREVYQPGRSLTLRAHQPTAALTNRSGHAVAYHHGRRLALHPVVHATAPETSRSAG